MNLKSRTKVEHVAAMIAQPHAFTSTEEMIGHVQRINNDGDGFVIEVTDRTGPRRVPTGVVRHEGVYLDKSELAEAIELGREWAG